MDTGEEEESICPHTLFDQKRTRALALLWVGCRRWRVQQEFKIQERGPLVSVRLHSAKVTSGICLPLSSRLCP